MLLLVALIAGHTPETFLKSCPVGPLSMHDVGVSQVHYVQLRPECPLTFLQHGSDCTYKTLSLHRFESAPPSVTVWVGSVAHAEGAVLESTIEAFTTTPSLKTWETRAPLTGCNVTLSAREPSTVYLVSGKAEEWWLAFTIPWHAYRIQWSWAYADQEVYYWPLLVTLSLACLVICVGLPVLCLWYWSVVIDVVVPTCRAYAMLGPVSDWMWTIVFGLRLVLVVVVLYLCVVTHRFSWWRTLGWLFLWLFTTGVGFGAWILVPTVWFSTFGH